MRLYVSEGKVAARVEEVRILKEQIDSQSDFTDESEISRFPPNRPYSNLPDNLITIKPPIRDPTYDQYHRT